MADVGSPAPDFNLYQGKSEQISLSGLKGKNVVIAFFPAAFTGVCQKELCTFQDSLARFNDMNAVVLGISADYPFAQQAFASQNNVSFPILSDFKHEAATAYGVTLPNFAGIEGYTANQRAVFVVNADGVIAYKWVGPNPGVEPNYDEVAAAVAAA